jgi:hypothetical protein
VDGLDVSNGLSWRRLREAAAYPLVRHNRWRTAWASVIGTSHLASQNPCQDYSFCKTHDGILVGAVSDGAGSVAHSEVGARMAVDYFVQSFGAPSSIGLFERNSMAQWIDSLAGKLADKARANGLPPRDYACTLLGVVASPKYTAYFQIGDGAIVTPMNDGYRYAFWPQHGEYVNETNFVTQDNAREVFEVHVGDPISEIAIFSDGIEHLVLNTVARSVHAPALRPIFDWLRTVDDDGCPVMDAYLASDQINSRTDDDKSLLMAVRS